MARKPDDWMPLQIGPYLADTTHLTRDQHGAYLLLLMAYWRRGGPLPADDARLASIAKATAAEWRKLKLVMLDFFREQDGAWHQKRADAELEKAARLTEAKASAGRKGAEKKWQNDSKSHGKEMAEPSIRHRQNDAPLPSPSPTSNEVKKELPADAGLSKPMPSAGLEIPSFLVRKPAQANEGPDFEEFWKAYPTDRNMPKKLARECWDKLSPEKRKAAIGAIPGFRRYCDENKSWYRPIYADRFLSQEKFEGYAAENGPTINGLRDTRERMLKLGQNIDKIDRAIAEAEERAA